jgi:hypothetical protein
MGVGVGITATLGAGAPSTLGPGRVADLVVDWDPYVFTAQLGWTAAGADGVDGVALEVDVRQATTPIASEDDWIAATSLTGGWTQNAVAGGSAASHTWVFNDIFGLPYYIAVRYRDAEGVAGPVSNCVSIMTPRATLEPRYQTCVSYASADGVPSLTRINGEQNAGGTLFVVAIGDFSLHGDVGLQLPTKVVSGNEGPGTEIPMSLIASGRIGTGYSWGLYALRLAAYRLACMDVWWNGLYAPTAAMMMIFDIDGLAEDALDQSVVAGGTGDSPSSGATSIPTQGVELVLGLVATGGPSSDTPGNWEGGFVRVARAGITGEISDSITLDLAYKVTASAAPQAASKSGMAVRAWSALCATFIKEAA